MEEIHSDNNLTDEEVEIDLLELLMVMLAHVQYIILGTVLGALCLFFGSKYLLTPKYTATAKMYMVSSSEGSIVDFSTLNMGTSLVADYEQLVRIRDVYEQVTDKLGLGYTYDQFQAMVNITNKSNTRVLNIEVESPNPAEARDMANLIADSASKLLPEKTDTLKPKIVEYAVLPDKKSSPNNTKFGLIGAAIGFMIPSGIIVLLFITDSSLRYSEDVEKAFGMMPLAVIPEGDIRSISDKVEKESRHKHHKRKT